MTLAVLEPPSGLTDDERALWEWCRDPSARAPDEVAGLLRRLSTERAARIGAQRDLEKSMALYREVVSTYKPGWAQGLHALAIQLGWVEDKAFAGDYCPASFLDDKMREVAARAEKAERERDEARAALDGLRASLYAVEGRVNALIRERDGAQATCAALRAYAHVARTSTLQDEIDAVRLDYYRACDAHDAGKGWIAPEVAEQMAAALRTAEDIMGREFKSDRIQPWVKTFTVSFDPDDVARVRSALAAYEKAKR